MPEIAFRNSRRAVLANGAAFLLTAPAAVAQPPSPDRLAFEVWRKGQRIGTHIVDMRSDGGGWSVRIAAALVVKLGPVPVFHYRHDALETWSAPDQFAAFQARTVSNGKVETVSARRAGDDVRIARSGGPDVLAPARAAPLTHWNRETLERPMFNPQTGAPIRETVVRRAATAALADGRIVPATAYALIGDAEITDWYDARSRWVALRGKVSDGSFLEYRRLG